jgi:hypothetical protein
VVRQSEDALAAAPPRLLLSYGTENERNRFPRVLLEQPKLGFVADQADEARLALSIVAPCWIGLRQVPIRYTRAPRFAGVGNYPFRKMLRFALDAVTGFSTRPLRIASYLGAIFGSIGALTHRLRCRWHPDGARGSGLGERHGRHCSPRKLAALYTWYYGRILRPLIPRGEEPSAICRL